MNRFAQVVGKMKFTCIVELRDISITGKCNVIVQTLFTRVNQCGYVGASYILCPEHSCHIRVDNFHFTSWDKIFVEIYDHHVSVSILASEDAV